MPITLEFEGPRTFVMRATGNVTFEDGQLVLQMLAADPRLGPGVRILTDARTLTSAPSTAELRRLAQQLRPLLARTASPLAIVTESLWVYGVARMFSVFAELANAKVHAFRDMQEARSWLAQEG